ncbi:retrovirus-related pol polyprotein from transposon TNT 1-94, partial [Tanacetum coccineum]
MTFDETPPPSKTSPLVDDDLDEEEAIKVTEKKNLENDIVDETLEIDKIVNIKESRNHPLENVIGNLNQRTLTSQALNQSNFFCFISTIEPKNVNEALKDDSWIVAMQEELNQFIANDVWELVRQPRNMTIIGTKWVFRNKLDENDIVSRNKARLVAQGYNQQEGIDYAETYAPISRLESIRILLAYACTLDFKLFQMDVKSAFLNGFINEEVVLCLKQAFAQLFGDGVRTFKFQLSQHMNNLETQLNAETLHEMDSKSALSVIKLKLSRETKHPNMNSIEQCIVERASHEQELKMTLKKLSERQLQIQQCKVQEVQSSVTSSGDETSSGIVSDEEIDKQELEAHYGFMQNDSEECKTNLDETSRALGEATSCRDSCLIALQNKQNEFEKYKAFNDRTIDYEILQTKLNETLGLLALKDIEIKEGLKTKAYEISVLNQKHDELVKKSLLTKSQLEGYLKEKTKVISDLKVKEEKDIDKMIEMDKQLKFLNEIVYTRNQSIQTIHMLAPKCATYNGRLTFANPRYLKKAQSEKPCLYEIPFDTSDPANRFAPDREETMTLDNESRSKLNKDYVKPYDYTKQNSLYEIFKAPSLEYLYQLERAKEVRKTMWRKPFVRTKPNIAKNVAFLPVSKSISKSRQVFNDMTFNINQFREIVDQAKSVETQFDKPTVVRQLNAQRIPKPLVLGKPTPFSNSPEMRSFQTNQSVNKTNVSDGLFKPVTQQNLPQNRNQAVRNTNVLKPGMYRIATTITQNREPQLPHASRNTNPYVSKSTGVNRTTSVSRPQLKCYQVKDKVVPNNSHVKFQTKEVEDHHRIFSISKKTKSVTACNDGSNSKTSNVNADCGKCVFNSDHDACVSRYLKD